MTLDQIKILSSIGAIKSFHELQYPIKQEELKQKLMKRAPIISRTVKSTMDIFQVFESPLYKKSFKNLEKQQDDIQNLTKTQSLLSVAFPEDKLPVTSPFAKSINLSQREEAILLRDWLNFMMGIHYQNMGQQRSSKNEVESAPNSARRQVRSSKDRLNFILMIVSYTMLQLRQQMSSFCNERGNVILKILKIILTIPNIFCELHEQQIQKSKEIIKQKANQLKQQKNRQLQKYFKDRKDQDKEIKRLSSQIKNNAKVNDTYAQQIQKLRRRLSIAESSLRIAQSKSIQELKEINEQQAKIMYEVYQNSKLDRIFVKQNEKQIRQDYEKNQNQEAIKDYLNLDDQPYSIENRKFGLNDILPPELSAQSKKLELQAQISFDTLKQLLQFAKKNPQNLKEKLQEFDEFMRNRASLVDKQTFTGQDNEDQVVNPPAQMQGQVIQQAKQNQEEDTNEQKQAQNLIKKQGDEESEKQEDGQNTKRQKKDEVEEQIEQQKEMTALLMRLKENGQQEFMTQLPVKLKTMIKRFYQSLKELPRDQYGDSVYTPDEITKLNVTLRRRGNVLKRFIQFLDPQGQIQNVQQLLGEAGINEKHSKEVQTDEQNLIKDQAFKSWIINNAVPLLEEQRKGKQPKNIKKNKSPKPRPSRVTISTTTTTAVKKTPDIPRKTTTQVKAFKFQNKQISSSKAHPYSKLLAILNKKIQSGVMQKKFASQISVRYLLKQIAIIYTEKLQASKESICARNQRLGEFFYDFTMNKYGLVKVTEKKVTQVVFSTSLHRNAVPDLQVIARFLGISSTIYRADDLNFYLQFCDQVNVMANLNFPTFLKKEKNIFSATQCYFGVAQEYVRALFQDKVQQQKILAIKSQLAMMIHVKPNLKFKSEKEQYEYYYYFPLPMGVVIMIIIDNYREFKQQIFAKIYPVAKSIICDKSVNKAAALQDQQTDQNTSQEPEEIMVTFSQVMSIIQSIIFFDETIYTEMKQFFQKNASMITMSQPTTPRQERRQFVDLITESQRQSPRTPTESQQQQVDVVQKISLDFLSSFIFKKKLITIR